MTDSTEGVCITPKTVACIENDPRLGMAAFRNPFYAVLGAFFIVLAYNGVKHLTMADTFFNVAYNSGHAIGGFVLSAQKLVSANLPPTTLLDKAIYLSIAGAIIFCSVKFRAYAYQIAGASLLGLAVLFIASKFGVTGTKTIMGGIFLGLTIAVVLWSREYFELRDSNAVGDSVFVAALVIALFFLSSIIGNALRNDGMPSMPLKLAAHYNSVFSDTVDHLQNTKRSTQAKVNRATKKLTALGVE